jgi:hypothetical protein
VQCEPVCSFSFSPEISVWSSPFPESLALLSNRVNRKPRWPQFRENLYRLARNEPHEKFGQHIYWLV